MKVLSFCGISYIFCLILVLMTTITSCGNRLEKALDLAGDNREEMEKVLEHFSGESDTLKYCAARFLIENMPYHHSLEGDYMDAYDSIYLEMSKFDRKSRNGAFNEMMKSIGKVHLKSVPDIRNIKSEYLISLINYACETWRNTPWSNYYDVSLFLNYVLPYRILNEKVDNWHGFIDDNFPYH